MAQEVRSIGLKSIKMGDIAPDGGMGTELTPLGVTYRGTAQFTTEENTTHEFWSEETAFVPEESITSEKGITQLRWNIINLEADALRRILGGTKSAVDQFWEAPRDIVETEQSIEVITASDVKLEIVRAKIIARFVWNLTRTDIAQVEITARVLTPLKADTPPYRLGKIAA